MEQESSIKDIQNYLTDLMYGIYLEVDNDNPDKQDNTGTYFNIQEINNYFQGTCIKMESSYDIGGTSPNGFSHTVYFLYDLNINPFQKNFVSNMRFLGGEQWTRDNLDSVYYDSLWDKFNDCTYSINFKPSLYGGEIRLNYDSNTFMQTYSIYKNEYNYINCVDSTWGALYYSNTTPNCVICPWNVEYELLDGDNQYYQRPYVSVNWHDAPARPDTGMYLSQHIMTSQYPSLIITDNPSITNTINNNYTGDTITTNNYIDNSNNSYTVYNGDNFITVAPVIPAGGLVNFNLNFDDLVGALQLAVDDINIRLGNSGDDLITIPTYQEYKYQDMGSFYITPIKQIDSLPAAPDIADTVIDVSEPLDMLSSGFGALLSAFDSLGVTLTLTFTFLACLVINKLRGD